MEVVESDSNTVQEQGDSPSFLQLFWDLAIIDLSVREKATKQLLAYLREHSESAEQPEFPGLSREMIYTLKRLCAGVCSSRDCAHCVYKLLIDASKVEGGMKRTEERDQYFGRIFGILAIFRSSRLLKERPSESAISVVENCTKEIVHLYNLKKWIRELCAQAISTMLKFVHDDLISVILTQCRFVFEEVKVNEDEELLVPISLSPASLLLLLQIQMIVSERNLTFENNVITRLFVENTLVSPSLLKNYMTIYKESSFTFPKLHPLWEISIQYIRSLAQSPDTILTEWWTSVTDQVMSSSPERKGMCLKVCQLLFPHVPSSLLPMVLNEKICNVITSNSGNSKNYLHEQTLHLLDFFVTSTEKDKERRIAILNIFFSTVGMNFDQRTRSSTCKRLMENLTAEDMNTFITHCYFVFLQPLVHNDTTEQKASSEEEEEEKSSESEEEDIPSQRRFWALENISRLIMNNSTFDPLMLIDFLYAVCCVQQEEGDVKEIPKTLSFLHTDFVQDLKYCSPLPSDAVREKAREVLFSTINALAVKVDNNEKTRMGMNQENVLYVYIILKHYEEFSKKIQKMKGVSLIREWEEDELANRKQLIAQIESIHKRTSENIELKQDLMFERLFVNLALEQVFKPDYSQFITDLIECYKQFTNTKQRSDERPIAVLLDIVLILLRTSSKALRDTSIQLFGSVCSSLSEEDVKEMLSVFWRDEGIEEEEDEDEMEVSLDEEEEEEEEEEEDEEEEKEEKEEEEKEDMEEEEEEDMDWEKGLTSEEKEAMKQEDLAIAKVLRIKKDQERLRKENKTELLNFKSRVIDLIETFVTKQPVHAAIGTIVTSLAEISQNLLKDKSEAVLNQRITNILKNKIAKNCSIPHATLRSSDNCSDHMKKLVELSKEVSLNDPVRRKQILICNATCLSLFVRSIQHAILEGKNKPEQVDQQIEETQTMMETILSPAIQDFKSKRSHLALIFFETLFTKSPLLCMSMIRPIQTIIIEDTSINNYKKLEFLGMLTCLLRNTGNTPNRKGYAFVRNNSQVLDSIYQWAKDKIENREKEGYEDFRKLPRRKLLNDFIHAHDNTKNAAEKKQEEKKEKKEKVDKEKEQLEKERKMKKTAHTQQKLQKKRMKKMQEQQAKK